jgi:hypothetical protein
LECDRFFKSLKRFNPLRRRYFGAQKGRVWYEGLPNSVKAAWFGETRWQQ